MTDSNRGDPHPDSVPEMDPNPDSPPRETPAAARDDDARSDLEQAVESRSDAVERGEGGPESAILTDSGQHDGVGGTGGVVRNQDLDQQ